MLFSHGVVKKDIVELIGQAVIHESDFLFESVEPLIDPIELIADSYG